MIFLLLDANCPINIDSKSYEITKKNMENNPNNRWIFDEAAGHVYQLMKNDSYPRYLRSDMYKEYLNGTKKKVNKISPNFFNFFNPFFSSTKLDFSKRFSWCNIYSKKS